VDHCPKCHSLSISALSKCLAFWPFAARCRSCGSRLRSRIPLWQNLLIQILGQLAFWTAVIVGAETAGGRGIALGVLIGGLIVFLLAAIPACAARLEAVPK
jgi:hypothetical protein